MQQRQLRLGDILDDYCPRERRVTNHAIVAMIGDDVRQTRCTTCDAEHEYKHARMPRQRRKSEEPAALYAQVAAGAPKRVTHDVRSDDPGAAGTDNIAVAAVLNAGDVIDGNDGQGDGHGERGDREVVGAEHDPPRGQHLAAPPSDTDQERDASGGDRVREHAASLDAVRSEAVAAREDEETAHEPSDAPGAPGLPGAPGAPGEDDDEGPVHRPLIRASLPRPEGQQPPQRPLPEFTIRQPGGRPNRFRPRHLRGGGGHQGQQGSYFQGNRSNGNMAGPLRGPRPGGGRPGMKRHGPPGRKRSK